MKKKEYLGRVLPTFLLRWHNPELDRFPVLHCGASYITGAGDLAVRISSHSAFFWTGFLIHYQVGAGIQIGSNFWSIYKISLRKVVKLCKSKASL